jgi:hypothetical protein
MKSDAPFLDVRSFVTEETGRDGITDETSGPLSNPFLSLYDSEASGEAVNPEDEEYVAFLNELYDEEFDGAMSALADEATALFEVQFPQEGEDPRSVGYQAERYLDQHFAPLVAEAEAMFETLAAEFARRDPNALTNDEIETLIDGYQASSELAPNFEEFFGKLKKAFKKVAKKAVSLAKKGVRAVAKLGLGPVLAKLRRLVKPLIKRVIRTAIGRLPYQLQPLAKRLVGRLPFLKEQEASNEPAAEVGETCEVAEIQFEFNRQVADLLFADTETQQDLEVGEALAMETQGPDVYPLAELDRARARFTERLANLKEGEDPTPHVEEFLPAILPVLRVGIKLAGRKRVVGFLAKLVGRLIRRFVGPRYTGPLARAMVDAGLRLVGMETMQEDEAEAARSAVVATVEETVRRVAAAPDYILDDQEMLEGYAVEAFEQAAAANLPPVLAEETYRQRPDLTEAAKLRGVWLMMPGRGRKRYKKYSRKIRTRLTPHKVSALESFEGLPLDEFLEEQLGLAPGEEVEAFVHLYEATPGTRLRDVARLEANTPGLGSADGAEQFHPLTREAGALLAGEPDLGRDLESQLASNPHASDEGERFYYLEIPGRRRLTAVAPEGRTRARGRTRLRLILDFPKNEIRVHLFLSEVRAQEIAVKLRQHAHLGVVVMRLRGFIERGLRRALIDRRFGRLKIVHEAVTPDQRLGVLRRLPALVPQAFVRHITQWVVTTLSAHLQQRSEDFIKAAQDTADGVSLLIALANPPGFPQVRQALKGKWLSLAGLKLADGAPKAEIKIIPGYVHE